MLAALSLVACDSGTATAPNDAPRAPVDTGAPLPVTPTLTYEFGAKFEPPKGRVVHGMGQWVDGNPQYLSMLPAAQQPAAELMFVDLGDTPRGWEPAQIAAQMAKIHGAGRVPVMDLSFRGLQPSKVEYDKLADKTYGIDSVIASSAQYDARIQNFVDVLRAYGHPVMLRLGGEFSGWWNGYHPYAYPVAFRKIVNMVRASGVTNVAFVWCYEPAAANDFDEVDASGHAKWFPGDDVVDWFSIDLYAAQDVGGATTAHGSGLTAYGRTLRFLDMAVAHHRPVIIAESTPSHFDLGIPSQASAAWTQWFAPYYALIASRNEIKWFHYVNYNWTKASYYSNARWKNNDLTASAALSSQYVAELANPAFLHGPELSLLKGWSGSKHLRKFAFDLQVDPTDGDGCLLLGQKPVLVLAPVGRLHCVVGREAKPVKAHGFLDHRVECLSEHRELLAGRARLFDEPVPRHIAPHVHRQRPVHAANPL